jgi:hypothetical protein
MNPSQGSLNLALDSFVYVSDIEGSTCETQGFVNLSSYVDVDFFKAFINRLDYAQLVAFRALEQFWFEKDFGTPKSFVI